MPKTIDAERSCGGGDVFNPGCPSRAVLEMLAEKWALLVVHNARQWPGAHVAVATAGRRYLRKDANPDPAAARAQRLRVASRLSRGTSAGRIFADCAWSFVERAHHHARPLGRKPSSRHRNGAARIRPTRRMMAARIRCLAVGRQPGRPEWADCVKDDFWLIVAPLRSNDEKRANACLRYILISIRHRRSSR